MYTQAELKALDDKEYRDSYVGSQVRSTIAHQIRCIREKLGLTQKEFSKLVGKPQSVISRLENTEYGQVTVQTLIDLAHALDVALVVKLAPYPEFLRAFDDLSAQSLAVDDYDKSKDELAGTSVMAPFAAEAQPKLWNHEMPIVAAGDTTYNILAVTATPTIWIISGVAVVPFLGLQVTPVIGSGR